MYELWETTSRNMVGVFPSEEEALEIVRQSLDKYGRTYAVHLALGYEDEDGETTAVAAGGELIDRALAQPA
jgi:lauroyl/myristoyl acyltransferase